MEQNKNKSSYQRLKEANSRLIEEKQKLYQDIYNLVKNKDNQEGIETLLKYSFEFKVSDQLMQGDES